MVSSGESRSDDDTTSGVTVTSDDDGAQPTAAVGPDYAAWSERAVAAVLDNAILAGVTWLALGAGFFQPTLTPGSPTPGSVLDSEALRIDDPLNLVPVGALVVLLVLQGLTGWTPGKLVVGIRVVRAESHRPAGLWTTLVRWVLHLLDSILLIGYLRPLWHARRQTFADGIARTVVVRALPALPRRPMIAVYGAALAACVLGLGYGCVPINSGGTLSADGEISCGQEPHGPALTGGDITLAGSVSVERERRMWTVRETRTTLPGAELTWTSEPSVRDVEYRVELEAGPGSRPGDATVSRAWDIGTGGLDWSDNAGFTHTRTIAADEDVHVAQVDVTDSTLAARGLGNDVWIDVRLIADGETVAACGGSVTYPR